MQHIVALTVSVLAGIVTAIFSKWLDRHFK